MVYPPLIRRVNPADTPILVLAVVRHAAATTVDAYAENILLQKISQVSGVGLVGIGGQQPAIRVRQSPGAGHARHQPRGRTQCHQRANVDLPKERSIARRTYTLNTNDQLLNPEAYDLPSSPTQRLPCACETSAGDRRTGKQPDRRLVQQNRAVILAVQRQPGANVIATVDRVKALLPQLKRRSLPPSRCQSCRTARRRSAPPSPTSSSPCC
jgi:HAE1 family hydrophobic/amphiphilic exporter-1